MSVPERREWTQSIWQALRSHLSPGDDVTILAGKRYREDLVSLLTNYGCQVHIPLQGMRIGEQLKQLSKESNSDKK